MSQEKKVFKTEWAGRSLTIETGQLAKQANGAVLVRYGDTVVLSTAVASKEPRDGYEYCIKCGSRLLPRNGSNDWIVNGIERV